MNRIPIEQNSERQIQRLAAQRQLYASAKTIFVWQFFVSGPVTVALAFAVIMYAPLKGYAALWGILVSLCDVAWLSPWQKRLRNSAAHIQEAFDCDVLSLPWNDLKAGKQPDLELIKEQAEKYKLWASSMPTLSDWYPKEVGCLPLHIARLACQRANCWWDSKQRKRYTAIVFFGVFGIFVLVLLLAMGKGLTIEDFILKVVAPLSPALILGFRQISEHIEAASRLDKLKEHAEHLWADALEGRPELEVTSRARNLQDEIFDNRKRGPMVFDAVFKRLRSDYETQMNHGAGELVAEAKQKLKLN